MGKRPAILLYDGDWIKDSIAGCSLAAQGLWLRMLFIAHNSDRYGYLSMNGKPIPPESIARRCGCTPEQYLTLLAELADSTVYSLTPEGVIFNRRMVRDHKDRLEDRKRKYPENIRTISVPQDVGKEDVNVSENVVAVSAVQNPNGFDPSFDGQLAFRVLLKAYPKNQGSQDCQNEFTLAIEGIQKDKGYKTRPEAFEWLLGRAVLYESLVPMKYQEKLGKWLREKTFNQPDSVWRQDDGKATKFQEAAKRTIAGLGINS